MNRMKCNTIHLLKGENEIPPIKLLGTSGWSQNSPVKPSLHLSKQNSL